MTRMSMLLGALLLAGAPAAAQTGRWITESGNLEVVIAPCGPALCGTVVREIANHSMAEPGKTMMIGPSVLGRDILTGLMPVRPGEWDGNIYNREDGQTYGCWVSLKSPDELMVRGYVFMPLIGRTQIWRRVPPNSGMASN